jgi:hypothetical protein
MQVTLAVKFKFYTDYISKVVSASENVPEVAEGTLSGDK